MSYGNPMNVVGTKAAAAGELVPICVVIVVRSCEIDARIDVESSLLYAKKGRIITISADDDPHSFPSIIFHILYY
jgi:hypothetical protein